MALRGLNRKHYRALAVVAVLLTATVFLYDRYTPARSKWYLAYTKSSFDWKNRRQQHPVPASSMAHPPSGQPRLLRSVQHDFSRDGRDTELEARQAERRNAVKNTFKKCWDSYREHAWGDDELRPVALAGANPYSGWGATLVDPLDTLWIMGLFDEFEQAATAAAAIDWDISTSRSCSVFETNIRYVGGLLSAYELSGDRRLLEKALELADMLYAAFDTPNRMPVNSFYFNSAKRGDDLVPSAREVAASVGTLSLEFTKLTEFTGDIKFFDAIERIKLNLQGSQDGTKLPGMWPTYIDLQNGFLTGDNSFTLGALADSLYEYLPKMYALLGGLDNTYAEMHKKAMATATKHLLYRPMLPNKEDILFSGTVLANGAGVIDLAPESQHLACFTGGMYALGGKLLDIPEHVEIGEKLARGCAWAYSAMPTGIMPEISDLMACDTPDLGPCEWNQTRWEAARWDQDIKVPGFRSYRDKRYILRPEAIESIFVLYRITGKKDLLDIAWTMFEAIRKATETEHAHSAIWDVTVLESGKVDAMESFWLAETLKYFYLIFSEPDVINLDDYVLNTEAHPFKIAKPH